MNRRSGGALLAGALSTVLLLSSPALAAGPGGGGSGGGHGGGGGGGGEPVDNTGSLYSDLVIALRATNGTPILKMYAVPATETEPATNEYCVQPVSYEQVPGLPMTTNPVDDRPVWVIPLQGEWIGDPDSPIAQDEIGACDPQPQYAMFVNEVEMERLNLARTSDEVIAQKIADVQTKLKYADQITLGPTGRISYDGTEIDASPENAGMYQSLMKSGTIPGLHPASVAGPPALVGPTPGAGDPAPNSQFDAWELAAMTIGAAAAKNTPLTIDAVEYYNRVIGFPPDDPTATPPVVYDSPWGVDFVRSIDPNPDNTTGAELANSERFVDYSGFSYNRSQTFKGSVTWLDVASLKWKVSKITDVVPFTNLSSLPAIGTSTLHGITAFAQLADDVRAMCNYVPDNTFIPGFYMDVPGVDTTADQLKAIHDPAVDIGTLPEDVFKTLPFQVTASLLNPWGGVTIPDARLRLTVDAPADLADGDVTATAVDPAGVPVTFAPDGNGNLVGWWGPETGFPVEPGYNVSTTFDVTVAGTAPSGEYNLTLDLVTAADTATVLASESGTLTVNENAAKVLWAGSVVKYATQASSVKIPLQVYAPVADTPGHLTLSISGPGDDPATPVTEALTAGDVKVYGSDGANMVPMPLTLVAPDTLQGTWDATFPAGYTPVTWYATVIEGAPVGNYAFTIRLEGSNTLGPVLVAFEAPESHGEQPPDAGEDATPPVVTLTTDGDLGATASFTFTSNEAESTFECMLTTGGVDGPWEACTSPTSYSGLAPGTYAFSVRAIDKAGNVSTVKTSEQWTVTETPTGDTTPPTVTLAPLQGTTPGSTATFTFTANETATFQCQLAKGDRVQEAWATCTSPKTYTGLKAGSYVFSVRATDTAGNTSIAYTYTWSVTKGGGGGRPPKR